MRTPYLTIVKRGPDAYDISDGSRRIAAVRLTHIPAVPGEWTIRKEDPALMVDESQTFDSGMAAVCFVVMAALL